MSTGDTVPHGRLVTTQPSWLTAIVVVAWLAALASITAVWILLSLADPDGALSRVNPAATRGFSLPVLALSTLGAIVVLRGDSPRYGLIMLATGTTSAILGVAGFYGVYSLESDVPLAGAAIWVQDLWMVEQMLLVLLLPALLPDGKVAAPKWRLPVKLLVGAWVILIVVFALMDRSASNFFVDLDRPVPSNSTGFFSLPIPVIQVSWLLVGMTSVVVGFGSLVTRWRRAEAEMRQRLKWVLFALGVVVFVVFLRLVDAPLSAVGIELTGVVDLLSNLAGVVLAVALGLAVLRFRLYDVDLVINRTIVYGLLTVMVVVVYVGLVVGVGALLPVEESVLALVATGFVAVGFAPLRSVVQGGVNRLMFGQRDDPYAVLTKMGHLLATSGAPKQALQSLVETIAVSLKLPGASIQLEESGEWREWASYGDVVASDENVAMVPLRHQGEVVGRLLVTPRSQREALSSQDLALLENVAHQAGALARSVRLTMALQRSREKLVVAQEEERRRIRHDLHDELGPSLASQTFQLDAILERIEDSPEQAKQLLFALKEQNKQLVADIRRLVYELRPPALDELGVAGALSIQTSQFERSRKMSIELETRPDPLPELPAAVEVAAYRIAREAISNTVRHAGARLCKTTLEATDTELIVTVNDDGVGIDPTRRPGVGMTSMRERTEELGGSFHIVSNEGGGTRVRASIPLVNGSASPEMVTSHG